MRAHVDALALPTEETQQLDTAAAGRTEPVRGLAVELGGLASTHDEVLTAEADPQSTAEHVEPLVPGVGSQMRLHVVRRNRHLVRSRLALTTRERDQYPAVALSRSLRDTWVDDSRRCDDLVEADAQRRGDGKQELEAGLALRRLQARERAG